MEESLKEKNSHYVTKWLLEQFVFADIPTAAQPNFEEKKKKSIHYRVI